ncbi:alanine racemase [Halanaerobaculum tunisiense]
MKITGFRPTWLEIDLDAIEYNVKQVQNKLNDDTQIMAVVKADAYGHGAIEVAKQALESGASWLAVATVEEGIRLRKAGFKVPILILGTLMPDQIKQVIENKLTPTIYTLSLAHKLSNQAKELDEEVKVHIKVDTGMGRIGILPDQAVDIIKNIKQLSNIEVEGIFTHFAVADEDDQYTQKQLVKFNQIIAELKEKGIEIPIKHTANSAATIKYSQSDFDLIRMGIILYGLYPAAQLKDKFSLKSALSWKAKLVNVKEVPKGNCISYGCTYTTKEQTKVGTLPVGYHDGYPRLLSNQADVLFQGNRYPIIGRVCMDQTMIDVTGTDAKQGDIVTLIGKEITAMELGDKINTINYEIVSRIGSRVPRVFYEAGEIIKIDDRILNKY